MEWNVLAFATCLVIAYFEKRLSSQKHQWELVAQKSEDWLRKNFATIQDAMTKKADQLI